MPELLERDSSRLYTGTRSAPLRSFKSEADAMRAGAWFMASFYGNRKAATFCEKAGIEFKALAEGTNSAGSAVVPNELVRAIVGVRETRGAIRATAQVTPLSSEASSVPRRSTAAASYWVGQGVAPTESALAVNAIGMVADKLANITTVSSELDEDSAIDLGDYLASEAGYALAVAEDNAGFLGDGTSTYGRKVGVITRLTETTMAGAVLAATGHDTFSEIDGADLATLIAQVNDAAMPGARWFCSQRFFGMVLARLAIASGSPIGWAPDASGRIVPWFHGFPVTLSSVLPQGASTDYSGSVMCLFGDASLSISLGERRGLTIARADKSPSLFANDQAAYKVTERVDIVVHDLGDATTAGALVGLVGN